VGDRSTPAGTTARELARTGTDLTDLLVAAAVALRALHDTAFDPGADGADGRGGGFDAGPDALVAEAWRRVADGRVDPARFDPAYRRYTPADLLALVERGHPGDLDAAQRTVVHGTARLDHLWFVGEAESVSGWSALQRAGVGDPYRDLATMAVDLAATVAPEALGPFVDAYGLEHADVVRLDWHVVLDQLLRDP
jgi:aminoglycoside phosphotransferase